MERFGRCSKCHEITNVDDPCCGSGVWFEGSLEFPKEVQKVSTPAGDAFVIVTEDGEKSPYFKTAEEARAYRGAK